MKSAENSKNDGCVQDVRRTKLADFFRGKNFETWDFEKKTLFEMYVQRVLRKTSDCLTYWEVAKPFMHCTDLNAEPGHCDGLPRGQ